QYDAFNQQKKKVQSKGLMKSIFRDQSQGDLLKVNAEKLNKLQQQCDELLKKVREQEMLVMSQFYSVQIHLMELAKKQLRGVLMKVGQFNVQRRRERQHLRFYANKLEELKPIIEVKSFLEDVIKPDIISGNLPLDSDEVEKITQSIERILKVDLTENDLMLRLSPLKEIDEEPLQTDFKSKYPLFPLNLTEADILSELPKPPEYIEIK